MRTLGHISEGEEASQLLQGLLELRMGNRTAGFNEEPLEERDASPGERPTLALCPCGFQEGQGDNLLWYYSWCSAHLHFGPLVYCKVDVMGGDQSVPVTCLRSHSECVNIFG